MKNMMKAFFNFMNGNIKVIEVTRPNERPYYLIRKGIFVHRLLDRDDYINRGKMNFRYYHDLYDSASSRSFLRFRSPDEVYEVLTSQKNVSIRVKPAYQWIDES